MKAFQFASSVNSAQLHHRIKENRLSAIASKMPKEDTPKTTKACTVVYNPNNNDSVFCAAQLAGSEHFNAGKSIAYYRYDNADKLKHHNRVAICGVDLTQEALDALKTCDEVIIFTQKENFVHLDFRGFTGKVTIKKPMMQESLGHVFDTLSNTASWQAFEWMQSQGLRTTDLIDQARILACKSFCMNLPVVSGLHAEHYESDQDEIRNKDFIYRLITGMKQALRSLSIASEVRNLKVTKRDGKTNSYLTAWQDARDALARCVELMQIDLKGGPSVVTKRVAGTENIAPMFFEVAKTYGDGLLVYEKVAGKKIYRVLVDDRDMQRNVVASLGARDTWYEGPVLCAALPGC